MLARTRGPSMKPAWAATTSRPPSESSVAITKAPPKGIPATSFSTSTAFIVLPSTALTSQSR